MPSPYVPAWRNQPGQIHFPSGDGYIVVNLGTSSQPVIDWMALAGTYLTGPGSRGWSALLGGPLSGIDLPVARTGLVVRRD
ncbi:hypothetical protein [Xanthomonas arboricola]|uniref:Uncharacterized protein n=1 Tax=Xanthomonas campestris pv. juglandis TaxID=195709 RepID=A0A381LX79_XANCJ|nr:hypothetical protein [Xanthomonas arboricola]CAD1797646.1 hypothetical protein XSP_004014 [Xanthomonas arboricola pv. juglandis]CAD7345899.1 hypothetical protein X12_000399 [Xanthomonas arboricola]CAD7375910.1 hypothetical protein X12_000428 [Xanthomonas arboricola]CAG2083527.1 hypothetical protein XCY_000427 [Xanthomonas arboricola pv. juglandis]SUZ34642.1 hypothetical protein CPBF1521_04820 [Xanthomonas arboricola pv. juglandis]